MNTDKKKHDMRDEIPATMSVTNTESRMAGGADNPNVSVDENPHLVKPEGPDQHLPEGQTTKGN